LAAFGRAGLRTIGEIGAGAERLALRAQHVGADFVVAVERLEGVGAPVERGVVEEIVRGPLDFADADMTFAADADILVGGAHTFPPRANDERRYCPAAGAPVELGGEQECRKANAMLQDMHWSWVAARWAWGSSPCSWAAAGRWTSCRARHRRATACPMPV